MLSGRVAENVSSVRKAEKMVTAYFTTPQGDAFINTYHQGVLPVDESSSMQGLLDMPEEIRNGFRMPLWNYLFEIHNGRFFRDLIGDGYLLLVPFGSLLFLLVTLSGVFDWLYLSLKKRR